MTDSAEEGRTLREQVAQMLFMQFNRNVNLFYGWHEISEDRRNLYRQRADELIPLVAQAQRDADVAAVQRGRDVLPTPSRVRIGWQEAAIALIILPLVEVPGEH